MKIDSGTVNMGSSREYKSTSVIFRRFTVENRQINAAIGGNAGNTEKGENGQEGQGSQKAQDSLTGQNSQRIPNGQETQNSQAGQNGQSLQTDAENETRQTGTALQDWQSRLQASGSNVTIRSSASQTLADIRQTTVRYIFELLFSYRRNRLGQWMGDKGIGTAQSWGTSWNNQQGNQNSGQGYNTGQLKLDTLPVQTNIRVLNYTHETLQIEKEETAFSTVGTVRTADGREINFNVNVGMSREFQQYYQEELDQAFVFCDPLVINLDTDIAELSDQTFYFDIDGDGELDEVSGMGAGSGYLALDKNNDGVINDGKELFGTASGNGFADLAEYDEDGNGWIDENDAIWDKLKIWCKDENGQDVLYTLADKGVGAICLQNVSTDFTLKGQQGQTKGAIRSSGVFLYENGNVGTVQHVDVAKYSAQA